MSLLHIENLSVRFRSGESHVDAVQTLSLSVGRGQFVAMVGESGSGKSVAAQAIMKLLPASASTGGTIHFDSEIISNSSESAMQIIRGKRIGMIFQEPMSALNPLHTIGRQIEEILITHQPNLHKKDRLARLHKLLKDVGLDDFTQRLDAYPHQLSGGQRQRVMIAMAMANAPDLLIADEPTTALDVTLQAQILALLKKLQRERGLAILMITHDLSIVQHLADYTYVMKAGKCVEDGPTRLLLETPNHAYTKALLAATHPGEPARFEAPGEPLLSCEKLSVSYTQKTGLFARSRKTAVLQALQLQLARGQTLGLVGESGSGKTTLALALLRLTACEGSIIYLGNRIDTLSKTQLRRLRADLQIVFQDPYASLNPRMNIEQIIGEGLRIHQPDLTRDQRRSACAHMLEAVGLEASMLARYPHEFSGGQRQRIAIARAMILAPKLVVLDEPTSALDVSMQAQVLGLLKQFQREQQVSYLFISHDLRTVRSIAHHVAVMRQGRIIELAETEQIFTTPQEVYTRQLIAAALNPAGEHTPI